MNDQNRFGQSNTVSRLGCFYGAWRYEDDPDFYIARDAGRGIKVKTIFDSDNQFDETKSRFFLNKAYVGQDAILLVTMSMRVSFPEGTYPNYGDHITFTCTEIISQRLESLYTIYHMVPRLFYEWPEGETGGMVGQFAAQEMTLQGASLVKVRPTSTIGWYANYRSTVGVLPITNQAEKIHVLAVDISVHDNSPFFK